MILVCGGSIAGAVSPEGATLREHEMINYIQTYETE
jgi:hypothetical protein